MPEHIKGEKKEEWMKRCVPIMIKEGKENEQAVAACSTMFDENEKKNMKNELETAELHDVEIFRSGTWQGITYTENEIDEIINNFQAKVIEPYINLNHDKDNITNDMKKFLNITSFGWIKNLYKMSEDGVIKVMADFKQIPKVIAQLIKAGNLKKRSIEIFKKFKHANGKIYKNVLQAVSFFGADGSPAITNLSDMMALFKDNESMLSAYKKSIEQDNVLEKVEIETLDYQFKHSTKKRSKTMADIELTKDEYTELIKFKADAEKNKIEIESYKSVLAGKDTELVTLKKENADIIKFKTETEAKAKKMVEDEAKGYVDGLITGKKLLPKFKDMKVGEYITYKNQSDDSLKLFKDSCEANSLNLKNVKFNDGDNENDSDVLKFKNNNELDAYITDIAKQKKITWEKANEEVMTLKIEIGE